MLDVAGLAHVVLCPGSRNAPLLFALAEALPHTVHVDERSAGFLALGMAKALGRPVAVCVTSGSAVANLLPAVCEAHHARVPLVLITADRPAHLQGCGAPQTMAQAGVFGGFAVSVASGDLPQALAQATGPVHVNVPLTDPGDPAPVAGCALPVLDACPPARRPVLVVGSPVAIADPGMPVLADALSGLRRPALPHVIATWDALCGQPPGEPDLILRLGQPSLTRAAWEWLARQRCPQLLGDDGGDWLGTATGRVRWPCTLPVPEAGWNRRWLVAEQAAQAARRRALAALPWSAPVVADAVAAHAGFPLLWLANSMAVRHANLHLQPRQAAQRVLGNRGLNGIDGTVGSFLGACRASGERGLCLIGDLALLHDLPALAAHAGVRGALVVLDDGGGGIFDFLPVASRPDYRRLVRADHDLDVAAIAAAFGLPLVRCRDRHGLAAALDAAAVGDRLQVVACDLRGSDGVAAHRAVLAAMRG